MKNDILNNVLNNADIKACTEFLNHYSKKLMNQYEYDVLQTKLKENSNVYDITQQNIKLVDDKQRQFFNFKMRANGNNLENELCLIKAEASLSSGEVKLHRLTAKRYYEVGSNICTLDVMFYFDDLYSYFCTFEFTHQYETLSLSVKKNFEVKINTDEPEIEDDFLTQYLSWIPAAKKINDPELNKAIVEMLVFNKRIDSRTLEVLSLTHDVDGSYFDKFYHYVNKKTKKNSRDLI